ncbi:MAG TPA: Asp-tRNA(Asn)/Glu-tRNA(Gln) amidotransferase subunit GatC [Candidatus Binatia bacterium]|jgi:aspartyl-tRNA(Asn)/glutamyl-tRNA(Gln) amidotransferase subunit C
MKITREEVRRVALLARLALSDEEEARLTEQLDKILQYMEKLESLETSGIDPMAHAVDVVNAFRDDRVTNDPQPEALLSNAPDREKTFLKVPKIIE